jgi:4-amino-4-deoxy-L-arabinose transferase-like glycosyltransferase
MTRAASPKPRAHRALNYVLLGFALLFPLAFLVLALLRLPYPFELEWIEGGSLSMVRRFLESRPVYVAPSLQYVPFNYPPLYFWLASLAARVLGVSFVPLRLISILSAIGCGVILYRHVVLETARRQAGVLAACLFFATYRLAGAWFDVGRADSLHLALLLGAFLVLRADAHRLRGPLLAGALVALAFLAKQSAAVAVLPVIVWLLLTDRVRGALFAVSVAGLIGLSTLALDAASGGWYRYYVFELARHSSIDPLLAANFWTRDFFGPLAVALLGGLFAILSPPEGSAGRSRGLTWAAVGGLVLSSWSVRSYPAAYDNVLMSACAGAALAFGLGWDALQAAGARQEPGPGARLVRFAYLAALIQFAVLLYNPVAQLPGPNDVARGSRLVEALRGTQGQVLVPCHDFLTMEAGKGEHFHEMALMAVAKSGQDSTAVRLLGQLRQALSDRRWSVIILDYRDWLQEEVAPYYELRFTVFPDDGSFWPVTGMRRRPEGLMKPRADSTAKGS